MCMYGMLILHNSAQCVIFSSVKNSHMKHGRQTVNVRIYFQNDYISELYT